MERSKESTLQIHNLNRVPQKPVDRKLVANFCEIVRFFRAGKMALIVKTPIKEIGGQIKHG